MLQDDAAGDLVKLEVAKQALDTAKEQLRSAKELLVDMRAQSEGAADEVRAELRDDLDKARKDLDDKAKYVQTAAARVQECQAMLLRRRQKLGVAESEARRLRMLPPQTGPLARSFVGTAPFAEPGYLHAWHQRSCGGQPGTHWIWP